MFCSARTTLSCRRLYCSSTSVAAVRSQARTSSGAPPTTGVLYQRKPVPRNARSPIYGFSAPSTAGISPVDVAYSRFLDRHGPLEVANRLLKMAEKKSPRTQNLQESVIWQSATASEYEMARVPRESLEAIRTSIASPPVNVGLWSRISEADIKTNQDAGASESSEPGSLDGKVIVVPFHPSDVSGKDFYEHLMNAVQDGLQKIEGYEMTSTKRKRRLKMNKHKFQKRRKEQEAARRKIGR